jgi:hypothetical protein
MATAQTVHVDFLVIAFSTFSLVIITPRTAYFDISTMINLMTKFDLYMIFWYTTSAAGSYDPLPDLRWKHGAPEPFDSGTAGTGAPGPGRPIRASQ